VEAKKERPWRKTLGKKKKKLWNFGSRGRERGGGKTREKLCVKKKKKKAQGNHKNLEEENYEKR